jgi:hypothetical protein
VRNEGIILETSGGDRKDTKEVLNQTRDVKIIIETS